LKYNTTFFPIILIGLAISAFSCNSRKETGPKQVVIDGHGFYFRDVYQSDFKSSEAYQLFIRGEEETRSGDFISAKKFFEKALEKDPNNGILLNSIGTTEYHLGSHKKAIENLRKAIKTVTDTLFFDYHVNLALALIMKGELEQKVNADSEHVFKGDFEQAILITNKVLANSKDTLVISAAYYHRSMANARLKDYELALKDIRTAIDLCDIDIFLSSMKAFEGEIEHLKNQEEQLKAVFKHEKPI
jgi:tetratricopeptide (TPR) repeat protein